MKYEQGQNIWLYSNRSESIIILDFAAIFFQNIIRKVEMAERLTMSLDQIISQRDVGYDRRTGVGAMRGGNSNRAARRNDPYAGRTMMATGGPLGRSAVRERPQVKHECAIKFLLNNYLMGAVIGNGGGSIQELKEITGAIIHAADIDLKFPGTNLRVLYITGSHESVTLAQSLVWEMIGHMTKNADAAWKPSQSKNNPGHYDTVQVQHTESVHD